MTIADVDSALDQILVTTGSGSAAGREAILRKLLGQATPAEADFVRRLLVGELRQGALAGLMGGCRRPRRVGARRARAPGRDVVGRPRPDRRGRAHRR